MEIIECDDMKFACGERVDFYLTYTNPDNNTKQYADLDPTTENTAILSENVQKYWTFNKVINLKNSEEWCAIFYNDKLQFMCNCYHYVMETILGLNINHVNNHVFKMDENNKVNLYYQGNDPGYKTLEVELIETFVLK